MEYYCLDMRRRTKRVAIGSVCASLLLLCVPPMTSSWMTTTNKYHNNQNLPQNNRRRLLDLMTSGGALVGLFPLISLSPANAFDRDTDKFSYSIDIPSTMKQSAKPVKTHQDEVNFGSESISRYQYGVTVDPVRINSLKEFGTPEEVAARVVTAEINRDGIFEVSLLKDPMESSDGAYVLEYLSVGKRGRKNYLNKIFIKNNELYVLTAQCKEENYTTLEMELKKTLESFQV